MPDVLNPLVAAIRTKLVPQLLGSTSPVSDQLHRLLSLPVRYGGLGIYNPLAASPSCFRQSREISAQLVKLILSQSAEYTVDVAPIMQVKSTFKAALDADARKFVQETAPTILPPLLVESNSQKGAGSWLSCLPLSRLGYVLDRRSFSDGLAIRYDRPVTDSPQQCACGLDFSIDHAMVCRQGGYPITRHNHIRDYLASLLRQVCQDVATEPVLQPVPDLTASTFIGTGHNTSPSARLDIKARGFWSVQSDAFFDVRVFYPNASSYRSRTLAAVFAWHEGQKRGQYATRVREVEKACFSPIVLTSSGGLGQEATAMLKLLASKLADKMRDPYAMVMGKLRADISFSLIKDSVLMLRGSRQRFRPPPSISAGLDLHVADARVPCWTLSFFSFSALSLVPVCLVETFSLFPFCPVLLFPIFLCGFALMSNHYCYCYYYCARLSFLPCMLEGLLPYP